MDHLAVPTDKGATGHQLKTVNSGHLRQLTGKMLIPNSRIRLLDTIGHGKVTCKYLFLLHSYMDCAMDTWICDNYSSLYVKGLILSKQNTVIVC